MASEIKITDTLQISSGNNRYQSQPTGFTADLTNPFNGPTPGAVSVSTGGTNISLAQLTALGGMCWLMNTDPTNYVDYGVWNGATYFPLGELLPGESTRLRLSRNLFFGAAGTALINSLRFRANTAACIVRVEAFDK